jgi:peptide deformylase
MGSGRAGRRASGGRPIRVRRGCPITAETTALDGKTVVTVYERGLARLIHHEVDHLDGLACLGHRRNALIKDGAEFPKIVSRPL